MRMTDWAVSGMTSQLSLRVTNRLMPLTGAGNAKERTVLMDGGVT
jgi:hypothetical protein